MGVTSPSRSKEQSPAHLINTQADEISQASPANSNQQLVETPEYSVKSREVSPHDSDFDFLVLHADALRTPSPRARIFSDSASQMSDLSGDCSPSRFFRSPLVPRARSTRQKRVATTARRSDVPNRMMTPQRLVKVPVAFEQEKKAASVVSDSVAFNVSPLDVDEIQCAPSEALSSPEEHNSFFSLANSLSSLDEFESIPLKLSPLLSPSSYELPKLLPPFPDISNQDDIPTTPQTKSSTIQGLLSAGSLAGGGISATCASRSITPTLFNESLPNIQASTSATPGQEERLKLGSHRLMTMKLHTSLETSPRLVNSHSSREIQAINNSLKRKQRSRRRKTEISSRHKLKEHKVQRKLLQTPLKSSTSSKRRPLSPWNGQTPIKTIQWQQTDVADRIPTAAPVLALNSTVSKKRKRTDTLLPTSMSKSSGFVKPPLGVQHAIALAITPIKHIKREVTATTGNYAVINAANGVVIFESNMRNIKPSTTIAKDKMTPTQVVKKAPCNCKKSKCLKLYCECFASAGYCDESCNCLDCANTTAMEEERQLAIASRLQKNPNAFKPKIGATADAQQLSRYTGQHPLETLLSPTVSIRQQPRKTLTETTKMHKHGCHCKKSACQKKYCECFEAGVSCGENCRCLDCKNQASDANSDVKSRFNVGKSPSIELDEAFISPILQDVRKRIRIDRETWKKDFASPFEASPERDRVRAEQSQSRLLQSKAYNTTSMGLNKTVSVSTPQILRRSSAKRPRELSPLVGQADKERGHNLLLTKREYVLVGKKTSAARIFVLPLFGLKLPPLECHVSAQIFRFLSNADVHNASLVSHLWNQVALGDTVWDYANFVPTKTHIAAARRRTELRSSRKKSRMDVKYEPNLALLSALR